MEKKSLIERISFYSSEIGKRVLRAELIPSWGRTFGAIDFARDRVKEEGYNVGPMCCDEPMVMSKKHTMIAKWRNIGCGDYHLIEGFLLSNDMREGEVMIVYLEGSEV